MTDIDTKELRRLMYAAHESGAGATTREYADYLIALDEAAPALLSEAEEAARLREELAALRAALAAERAAREKAEAKLAERGKPFIAAAEEAYWLLAWTWQSHLTGPGKPFDMSIFAPEARNMMTKAEQDLFDALSEIEP